MFSYMTSMQGRAVRRAVLLSGLALASWSAQAQAPPPILGDVNGDGKIDVLDIQSAANIALGTASSVSQADADENASVNVLDVQVLINSALGVGGLVQPVAGTFAGAKGLAKDTTSIKAVAISTDGRKVEATLDAAGNFELPLAVKTNWSISFISSGPGGTSTVGTVDFPLAGSTVSALPLPTLGNGSVIDLGSITAGIGISTSADLRTLLAERGDRLDTEDHNDNGLPDVVEGLLLPYPWTVAGSGITVPAALDVHAFEHKLGDCINDSLEYVSVPDLTGIEVAGVPAFAVPILSCLPVSLTEWLSSSGSGLNSVQVAALVVKISAAIQPRINAWVQTLGNPNLVDGNHNGVPDYLENEVCHEVENGEGEGEGETGLKVTPNKEGGDDACGLDGDADGVPDFAEDDNDDGTPNYLDPENHSADDADGDGIANSVDLDDDNDGALDYADSAPLDPAKS